MTDPAAYPRRILLAVTGLSPQIITETLYALAVDRRLWVPTEIRIITTRQGAEKAQRSLLSDDPGWFHRLRTDYRLPEIAFGVDDIRVIAGPDGRPLDDILAESDNAAVADFITEELRALTADPQASLHVSIAGGRKTMGFYLGYALSLFGREQDRLSHVLVPSSLESRPDFFYPRPADKEARVHLGPIPFVRLRDGLTDRLLEGRARFSDAVVEAQKALAPLALHLDPATLTVTAGGESFTLKPAQFALYWMMAERCIAAKSGVHWSERSMGDELLGFCRALGEVSEQTERAYRRLTEQNFDPAKAHVNRALRSALGERRAAPYRIVALEPIAGTRYRRFGLALAPETVTIAAQACAPGKFARPTVNNRP
jgi:CRISPR-associated protein (TIGR02584 family)